MSSLGSSISPHLIVRHRGVLDYLEAWQEMQSFTNARTPDTSDELWFLQHKPIYTLGKNGKLEHVLNPQEIPVINSDRGGQVTYHGPGQLIVYTLLDINRMKIGVRSLVTLIEQTIIDLLASYDVPAVARRDAPGVYVNNAKIAALGLRVRKGCCFHGMALNIDMDLEPFSRINPCGYEGLEVTQFSNLVSGVSFESVSNDLEQRLMQVFKSTAFKK